MKAFDTIRSTLKLGLVAPLAALGLMATAPAHADMLLLTDTSMVAGSSNADISFNAPSAGMVTAVVNNLPWPQPLSSLAFSATSSSASLGSWMAPSSGPMAESFQVSQAGTYFAHIMATATGSMDLGLYSLTLTFSPAGSTVPLPAGEWMLLLGVLILFGLTRVLSAFGSQFWTRGSSPTG